MCPIERLQPTEALRVMQGEESEADLQLKVIRTANLMGWTVYHTRDSRGSQHGFPDVVLVRPPSILFLELKREDPNKGRVSLAQQVWLRLLSQVTKVEALLVRPSDWDALEERLRRGS